MLTQLNMTMNAMSRPTRCSCLTADDVILGCLPLFHSFGQTCAMNAGFYAGVDPGAAAAVRRRRRARADRQRAGQRLHGRADHVHRAAGRGPGRRAPAGAADRGVRRGQPAGRRHRQLRRRCSAPTSTRATGCPRPRRSRPSTSRSSAASPARSAGRSGAPTRRSRPRRSRTGSNCCRRARSARWCCAGTTCSPAT